MAFYSGCIRRALWFLHINNFNLHCNSLVPLASAYINMYIKEGSQIVPLQY